MNAWRSVGPFRLPSLPDAPGDMPDIWPLLMASALAEDTAHDKAIEFAATDPLPHWFGLPVSRPGFPRSISRRMLADALGSAGNGPGGRVG